MENVLECGWVSPHLHRRCPARLASWLRVQDRYAGIIKAAAQLGRRSAIIDGEIIVQDERGVSDFEPLKSAIRWQPQRLVFCAFDLLHLNGNRDGKS